MKVIITGVTGLVGSAVARACIANEKITHLFVLTRKALPEEVTNNQKVTVIIHEDFSAYPRELLQQLAGAEACLWAIGGRATQFPDVETYRKVQVDYTLAAANAFITDLAPGLLEGKRFRFLFCSGKTAEWDQEKMLSFMADTRRIKGQVEKGLCELADANKDRFEVWCVRPSGILPPNAGLLSKLTGKLYDAITADNLARAMVQITLDGYPERIIENDSLLRMAETK